MKGFTSMLKQAQELQGRMVAMQEELAALEIEGAAGGGLVRVTLTGKGDMKRVSIDPSLAGPEDIEIVEDLVVAAHADAKSRLEAAVQEKMKQVTGGLPLPPGLGL